MKIIWPNLLRIVTASLITAIAWSLLSSGADIHFLWGFPVGAIAACLATLKWFPFYFDGSNKP